MPTREGIQHFVDTSEPNGVQPGDEWWNIGTGRYYKRVVFSNGGVGWTEIGQPSLIVNNANTWPLAQVFSTASVSTLNVSGASTFSSTVVFSKGLSNPAAINTTPVFTISLTSKTSPPYDKLFSDGTYLVLSSWQGVYSDIYEFGKDGIPVFNRAAYLDGYNQGYFIHIGIRNGQAYVWARDGTVSYVLLKTYSLLTGTTIATAAGYAPYGAFNSANVPSSAAMFGPYIAAIISNSSGNQRTLYVYDTSIAGTSGPQLIGQGSSFSNSSDIVYGGFKERYLCARINGTLRMWDMQRLTGFVEGNGVTVSVPVYNDQKWLSDQNYYYYMTSNTVCGVYNVENPTAPVLISTMTLNGSSDVYQDHYVKGDCIYLIRQTGRIEVYDISNINSPVLIQNTQNFCRYAGNLYFRGNYIYALSADGNNLLVYELFGSKINSLRSGIIKTGELNVENGTSLKGVSNFYGPTTVHRDLVVMGNEYNPTGLFGSTRISSGAITLGYRSSSDPYYTAAGAGQNWAIYNRSGQLYAGTGPSVLIAFPSSSGTIALTSQITSPNTLLSTANTWNASNTFTFSAASTDTFVAQRTTFLYVNSLTKNASNTGYVMVKYGNHLITGGGGNIQVWDVSRNPASIVPVSVGSNQSVTIGSYYGQVRGTYLYTVYDSGNASTSGLRVNDLRTLSAITFTGTILLGVRPYNYIISGGYIYVLSLNLLSIYKMTGITSATLVSSTAITTGSFPVMQVIGNTLYFAGGATFYSYDISNPSAPVQRIANNAFLNICNFIVRGRLAYISDYGQTNALITLDLSTLTQSSITSNSPALGNASSAPMIVHGNRLYVYSFLSDYIFQVNLDNPAVPAWSSALNNNLGSAGFKGNSACIVNKTLFIGTNSTVIPYFILGGSSIHQLEASGVETDQITVKSDLQVLSDADVHGSLSVMGNQGISGDMIVAGVSTMGSATMGSATMGSATMTSASITTITGNTTHSGILSGNTLTGNKITQPNLPFVVNDISRYFDGNTAAFPLRKDQSALTSLVTSSGTITSIVSNAVQFVVTHSLGTIVPGSYITISGCSTAGYNNTWLVKSSTSTTCTVVTPVNLASAPSTPGTLSGSLASIVDSKDVEVILNGQYLDPYVTELRYPWITEWDANGGFKVSGSNLILYNAPVSGDKATVKVIGISQSVQTRRYPFSSATIALGE